MRNSKWIYCIFIKRTECQEDLPRMWWTVCASQCLGSWAFNGTTATVERRTRGANRKFKQSFLFSSGFFYHFYYLLFQVIHQQAEAQLFSEVINVSNQRKKKDTQKLHISLFNIIQQCFQSNLIFYFFILQIENMISSEITARPHALDIGNTTSQSCISTSDYISYEVIYIWKQKEIQQNLNAQDSSSKHKNYLVSSQSYSA